jgi:hypothetical protein
VSATAIAPSRRCDGVLRRLLHDGPPADEKAEHPDQIYDLKRQPEAKPDQNRRQGDASDAQSIRPWQGVPVCLLAAVVLMVGPGMIRPLGQVREGGSVLPRADMVGRSYHPAPLT